MQLPLGYTKGEIFELSMSHSSAYCETSAIITGENCTKKNPLAHQSVQFWAEGPCAPASNTDLNLYAGPTSLIKSHGILSKVCMVYWCFFCTKFQFYAYMVFWAAVWALVLKSEILSSLCKHGITLINTQVNV